MPSTSTPGRWPSCVRCLRSAGVGFRPICHATHARKSMRRKSSGSPVSRRLRPTPVTVMGLGVWPNNSRTRGSLSDERRRDGGCVRRGWWCSVPSSAVLSPPIVTMAMRSRRTCSSARLAWRGLITSGSAISALCGRLRAGGLCPRWWPCSLVKWSGGRGVAGSIPVWWRTRGGGRWDVGSPQQGCGIMRIAAVNLPATPIKTGWQPMASSVV